VPMAVYSPYEAPLVYCQNVRAVYRKSTDRAPAVT
jgi:hypothetical protein